MPDQEEGEAHVEKVADDLISSTVIELVSPNLSNTYITCPAQANRTLGIKLPFLVLIVKNLNKYFSFEVEVLDDKNEKRRFRASNYQVRKFIQRVLLLSFDNLLLDDNTS